MCASNKRFPVNTGIVLHSGTLYGWLRSLRLSNECRGGHRSHK